ncbi:TetR/AcrR family transcriptional regulator [Phycicoccus sp. BSK3Z-2]|uniref:TetR/AcrR family transcriptional regulator n=1 Tax=Phycicoccus avicenniae TaxID=2828860 RepID=A0A941DB53_9MICO|nr:TetR family transcriptional regulator [Phycicoccus avicenniae]MBR7744856.1 TetR/AcrR family transcriptional regulator [Phycicoccus avicenniae]
MGRREEIVEAATDHALDHGLVGLSLRPLAEALGTSDRMLLYHLGSKDALVAEVVRCATARALERLRALPASASPGAAVRDLHRLWEAPAVRRCQRLHVEASALGLFGREPYASTVGSANALWSSAVRDHLARSGVPAARLDGVTHLVDATFMGLELDASFGSPAGPALETLVAAVERLCSGS